MSEPSRDVRQTLLYNEQKLEEDQARFLGAFNYWQEIDRLTFDDKLHRLQEQMVLNERSQAKIVHLSLNFHPNDQLSDKTMREIAGEFMQKIDFADQPALVYRHLDAGHPHMHVVTTNIRPDGSRIKNDLRAPRHLMEICAGLDNRYHLTPAIPGSIRRAYDDTMARLFADKERQPIPKQTPDQPLKYGQSPTKTSIERVLNHVLDQYHYTSLDQLNAALSIYRVRADRGSEQGRMYQCRGLYYRMIDENGRKIGAPIKASSFDQRPTLDYLEKKFIQGHFQQRNVQQMRETVNSVLQQYHPENRVSLSDYFHQRQTQLVVPAPGKGFYYIDSASNTVYKDSDLGVDYMADAVLRRSGLEETLFLLGMGGLLTMKPKDRQLLIRHKELEPDVKLRLFLQLLHQNDRRITAQAEQMRAKCEPPERERKTQDILEKINLKIEHQTQLQIEAQTIRQTEKQEKQAPKQSLQETRRHTHRHRL